MTSFFAVALAVACPNGTDKSGACILSPTLGGGAKDLLSIMEYVTNWFFTILLVLAVLFIILAAYKYLTSGGGEEVGKAHKMLLYAAVAIAVAVLAKGIVNVTKALVGGSSSISDQNAASSTRSQLNQPDNIY